MSIYDIIAERIKKSVMFVEHIEKHLKGIKNAKVICKMCGKSIDEIYKESEKK